MAFIGQNNFEFEFAIGDKVMIDECLSIQMTITSIQVFPEGLIYKCSWFNEGGNAVDQIFDAFRVMAIPPEHIKGYYQPGHPLDRPRK